jgi:hypothetical protein
MTWIRGFWWDGFWFLGPVPLAAALAFLTNWVPPATIVFWAVLLTQTAHLIAPVALAWVNTGYRKMALDHPRKFVGVPLLIIFFGTLTAFVSSYFLPVLRFNPETFSISTGSGGIDLENPFIVMLAIYALWNAYHFGMQNFGIMSVYRTRANITHGVRGIDKIYCLFVTNLYDDLGCLRVGSSTNLALDAAILQFHWLACERFLSELNLHGGWGNGHCRHAGARVATWL